MPWSHCDLPFILDDEVCPTCGQDKDSWTVELDKTRTLVIGLPKKKKALIDVELRDPKGNVRPGRPYRAEFASGLVTQGKLDAKAQARFEQLSPGPCQVTFPEDERLEKGQRFGLAAPFANAVRALPAPLPLWKLERVASVADPALQASVAETLVPPPAEPKEPPTAGKPLKVDLPLRVTFAAEADAQAWLLRNRAQVHVDGQAVACGAFVASAGGRVTVHVQFKVKPGDHHVIVASTSTTRDGAKLRTLLLSQRLSVEADPESGDGAPPPTTLVGAPLAAGPIVMTARPVQPASAPGAKAPASGPAKSRGKKASPFAAHAASGERLVSTEFAPDPIGLTKPQLERGAGELYVFQPERAGLKVDLPLTVTFATVADAQRWLLEHRPEVNVDGRRVACGAFVESAGRVHVQFKVTPGDHHVIVSVASRRGDLRTLLLSQRLAVESDVTGDGTAASPAPGAASEPQPEGKPSMTAKSSVVKSPSGVAMKPLDVKPKLGR